MKLLKFNTESIESLHEMGEFGMDFWIVVASWDSNREQSVVVAVRGDGHAMPEGVVEDFYSLDNMLAGQSLPQDIQTIMATFSVTLPPGYLMARGAHKLLGSTTLAHDTRFSRYTSSPIDGSFDIPSRQINQDTYLTSINDQQFVNSGFGAVGRYALPLPIPASYQHDYTLPAGTKLLVGTVAPYFGQAGGGVEVKTISRVSGVSANATTNLSDY